MRLQAINFKNIFRVFNLGLLGASLVRFWALFQAKEIRWLRLHICAVANPFHMHGDNAASEAGSHVMIECLVTVMLCNQEKQYLLVPYVTS